MKDLKVVGWLERTADRSVDRQRVIYENSLFEAEKRTMLFLWDVFLWLFAIQLQIFTCSADLTSGIDHCTLRMVMHAAVFALGLVLLDNAVLVPLQLSQYSKLCPEWKHQSTADVLFTVICDKQWNAKCRAPLFRMHKLIGHSLSFDLSREERSRLTDYWQDEVEKESQMYWSYSEPKSRDLKNIKMLPKSMVARFVGYFALLVSGFLFVVIPSHLRDKALKHCGLSNHHSASLIWLFYLTMTMMGELCQLLA